MGNDYDVSLFEPEGTDQSFYANDAMLPGLYETFRCTENAWGYWQAYGEVYGDIHQLIKMHHDILGFEVRKRVGSLQTWEGYIHELRLYHGDVCRVFGYDVGGEKDKEPPGMFNAVRVAYGNRFENPKFEIDGAGPPVFESWSQTIGGTDTITAETTHPGTQLQACKITYNNNGTTYVEQSFTVTQRQNVRIAFYTSGDGTVDGRYSIYDVTNAADIVTLVATGETKANTYKKIENDILVPTGCTSIRLRLQAPSSAGYAIFDAASARLIEDDKVTDWLTDWATQASCILVHGRREITLDGKQMTPTEAAYYRDSFLKRRAWPMERQENGSGETRLELYMQGYIHRAGWKFTDSTVNGLTDTLTNHLTAIVASFGWLTASVIKANTATLQMQEAPQTFLAALRDIAEYGDASGNMWRIHVQNGRTLIYEQVSFTPSLAVANGKIYRQLGDRNGANYHLIKAMEVVRNYDFPDSSTLPDSLLTQRNDSLLESVTITVDGFTKDVAEMEA